MVHRLRLGLIDRAEAREDHNSTVGHCAEDREDDGANICLKRIDQR